MTGKKQIGKSATYSLDPLLTRVTCPKRAVRRNPIEMWDKVFGKMDNFSTKNEQIVQQIHMDEVQETLGRYESYIKQQFSAFNNMMEQVKETPDDALRHVDLFKEAYERNKSELSLEVYYCSMTEAGWLFGRPLLKVYLEHCAGSREVMEHRCSHLTCLLLMGFTTLLAYTAITGDSGGELWKKWGPRLKTIETQMQDSLNQCKDDQMMLI